jgi:hypothetical protein
MWGSLFDDFFERSESGVEKGYRQLEGTSWGDEGARRRIMREEEITPELLQGDDKNGKCSFRSVYLTNIE